MSQPGSPRAGRLAAAMENGCASLGMQMPEAAEASAGAAGAAGDRVILEQLRAWAPQSPPVPSAVSAPCGMVARPQPALLGSSCGRGGCRRGSPPPGNFLDHPPGPLPYPPGNFPDKPPGTLQISSRHPFSYLPGTLQISLQVSLQIPLQVPSGHPGHFVPEYRGSALSQPSSSCSLGP